MTTALPCPTPAQVTASAPTPAQVTASTPPPARTPAPTAARADLLAALAVLVTMTFWASSFVAIRFIGTDLSPGPLALIRVVVATLVLAPFVFRRGLAVPRGTGWLLVGGYAALWMALYTVVLNAAEHHLDAGTAAMLVNVAPILVTLWVGFVQRAGFAVPLVAGLVVAFVGVAIIGLGAEGGQRDLTGLLLGLLAAALYAAGVILQKGALRTIDPLSATWWGTALGAAALVMFLPATVTEVADAPTGAVVAAVYMGIFPTAVAFSLWAYALRRVDAARLSLSSYLVPAITVLLSWALLAEVPTVYGLVGGSLCLVGVAVSRLPRGRRTVSAG